MVVVAFAIAVVWGVLLGAAWLALVLPLGRAAALALPGCCYLVLAALALLALGPNVNGLLGIAGMLFPLAVATGIVVLRKKP